MSFRFPFHFLEPLGFSDLVLFNLSRLESLDVDNASLPSLVGTLREGVEGVFFLVQLPEGEPEGHHAHKADARDRRVQPGEQWVLRQRHKGLGDGARERVREPVQASHKGTHVLGRLGEGILETGDVGKDLGQRDDDVRWCLDPHRQVRWAPFCNAVAVGGVVSAGGFDIDVMLDDRRDNHAERSKAKTSRYPLDRCEAPASPCHCRVDDLVADGNEDQQGKGVQVVDDIIWHSIQFHGTCLGRQIVGHLVVHKPVDG